VLPHPVDGSALLRDAGGAQLQQLLARLEGPVYLARDAPRAECEAVVRQLYLRTQDQIRVLQDALALEGLE
jgi:hypothetical protein